MKIKELQEAKHVSHSDSMYGTAVYDDGQFLITAPFRSEQEAERYADWEMKEYDLDPSERAEVISFEPPAW